MKVLKNRRRISSEAMRVRMYLNDILEREHDAHIAVTGDLNDGPGLDYFECRYLTHNTTDLLLGSIYNQDRIFFHVLKITQVPSTDFYTAIF